MISIKLVNVVSKCFLMQYYWKENRYKIKRDKKLPKNIYKRKNTKQRDLISLGDKGPTGNIQSNENKEENGLQDLHD